MIRGAKSIGLRSLVSSSQMNCHTINPNITKSLEINTAMSGIDQIDQTASLMEIQCQTTTMNVLPTFLLSEMGEHIRIGAVLDSCSILEHSGTLLAPPPIATVHLRATTTTNNHSSAFLQGEEGPTLSIWRGTMQVEEKENWVLFFSKCVCKSSY